MIDQLDRWHDSVELTVSDAVHVAHRAEGCVDLGHRIEVVGRIESTAQLAVLIERQGVKLAASTLDLQLAIAREGAEELAVLHAAVVRRVGRIVIVGLGVGSGNVGPFTAVSRFSEGTRFARR